MKNENRKELTRAELEVMQVLWKLDGGYVNEILDNMPVPKPAYTTVSTIVRILERKGFVKHESIGRNFKYSATLTREEYTSMFMNNVMSNFFNNSFAQMVSFFAEKEKISANELDEIMGILSKKR